MSDFPPLNIAPQDDGSGVVPATVESAPEAAPITDQEVGEYREQDRFLPVRCLYGLPWPRYLTHPLLYPSDRERCAYHESCCTWDSKDL